MTRYEELIDYIIEKIEEKADYPEDSGCSYPISFRQALKLFLEDLEEDVLISNAEPLELSAYTEEELANQAFEKKLDRDNAYHTKYYD